MEVDSIFHSIIYYLHNTSKCEKLVPISNILKSTQIRFELCHKDRLSSKKIYFYRRFSTDSPEIQHFLQLLEENMANAGPPTVHILV